MLKNAHIINDFTDIHLKYFLPVHQILKNKLQKFFKILCKNNILLHRQNNLTQCVYNKYKDQIGRQTKSKGVQMFCTVHKNTDVHIEVGTVLATVR